MKTADFIQSFNSTRDLSKLSTQELRMWEKKLRDVTSKRYKALEAKQDQKHLYAPHSFNAMNKYIEDNGGLPKTDRNDPNARFSLKRNIGKMKEFLEHETSTLTGAKFHANRLITLAAVGPREGPLTSQEKKIVEQYRTAYGQDQELMSEFWKLYEQFVEDNERNFKYDPERTLALFTSFYRNARNETGGFHFGNLRESIKAQTEQAIIEKNRAVEEDAFEGLLSSFKKE